MNIQSDTKISDILSAYPWLKQQLIAMNPKFKKLDSPMAKILLKRATVQDACKKFNTTSDKVIGKLQDIIVNHEKAEASE